MILINKLNAFLAKFVGPNAAHVIDGLIGVALVGAAAFAASAPARLFLLHHALLGVIVTAGVPLVTAVASKFRKAAGSSAPLADELASAVTQAVKDAHAQLAAAPTVTPQK